MDMQRKMLTGIKRDRPVVSVDVETTGLSFQDDRIVEINATRVELDGTVVVKHRLVNPMMPIPKEAQDIHGIGDEDVKAAPQFSHIAKSFHEFLQGCDIVGFGFARFDCHILKKEFERAGIDFDVMRDVREGKRRLVDPMVIFHTMEPRDLAAAVKFYCGHEMEKAHTARADAMAALEVLQGQLVRYPDTLQPDIEVLSRFCQKDVDPNAIDVEGKLIRRDGEVVLNFSKQHKGRLLREIAKDDPGFLRWMLKGNFTDDVKAEVRKVLTPPTKTPSAAGSPAPATSLPQDKGSAERDR